MNNDTAAEEAQAQTESDEASVPMETVANKDEAGQTVASKVRSGNFFVLKKEY